MISVAEALARVLDGLVPLPTEMVPLGQGVGRVLAEDLVSKTTHPPSDVSAMDGYAVRAEDVDALPTSFKQIGTVAAGATFLGTVGKGETVRIFTGAPVPKGASAIVIQEDAKIDGDRVVVTVAGKIPEGRHIRRSGLDFKVGDRLLKKGQRVNARDIALAAAMNYANLPCTREPLVAMLSTGDELVAPGTELSPSKIVASSSAGISAELHEWGARVRDLGIAKDEPAEIRSKISLADGCDILITLGGASVGDHDLVRSSLQPMLQVDFWKIAMRPGKPLIYGRLGEVPFLGLPGNPVSAFVCALLFLKPMIFRLLGDVDSPCRFLPARLSTSMLQNDRRQDYVRCRLKYLETGEVIAAPLPLQDSSMLSSLAAADGLIVRPPEDPLKMSGEIVQVLVF
jgi:molybdopterin molybdotransferase